MDTTITSPTATTTNNALPATSPMENAATPRPRFLCTAEVKAMTGLKNTTLYDLIRKGLFPKQVKQGRSSFWWEHEVLAYMENLPRA